MNRIPAMFRRLRREGRCGLIAYVTCGDPDMETTIEIVLELERRGADAIELGVPFSDPIADGPVIQAASWRSLRRGTTLPDVFGVAREVRKRSAIPLIVFTYVNPLLKYGPLAFASACRDNKIDAALVTDLPPEAAGELRGALRSMGVGTVFLLAPTSGPERVRMVNRLTDSFVYYVSTAGVTGERKTLAQGLTARLDEIRSQVRHPLAVGFGVSEHEHYLALSAHADAVVVGSAIVRAIGDGPAAGAAERAGEVVGRIAGAGLPAAGGAER